METTFFKTVKGSTMVDIFDNSEILSVRYFEAKQMDEATYDPENKYRYEITVRHAEETNGELLFQSEIDRIEKGETKIKETKEQQQKEALQNFATSLGLTVNKFFTQDNRKKVNKWYLTKGKTSVSPVLNYEGLNEFMTGWSNCLKETAAPELLAALQYAVKFINLCPLLKEDDKPKGLEKWEEIIKKATE